MTAEQEQVKALARAIYGADGIDPVDAERATRAVLASDWLAKHDAQVRAEATAAVAAQVEAVCVDWESYRDMTSWHIQPVDAAHRVRAALTPDAGAALRARGAKALRDAADSWQTGDWASAPHRADRIEERLANAQYVCDWLRNRADALEAGGE